MPKMSGESSAKFHSKVVLLGSSGVGKTQFMAALFDSAQSELSAPPSKNVTSTIGVDFRHATRTTRDGTSVKLLVWDTAGQERFANLMPNYTRESEAIILLYDITDVTSFNDLQRRWQPLIDEHRDSVGRANLVCYLVANKIDLAHERKVEQGEGRAYANQYDMIYAETTVLRRRTVHNVVDDLADRLARMHNDPEHGGTLNRRCSVTRTTNVVINNSSSSSNTSRRCCA